MFKKKFFRNLAIIAMIFSSITNISANSVVVSGLKGTYNWLPEEKKRFSPIHGVIMMQNGELKKLHNQEKGHPIGDIVRSLFHELDNKIRITEKFERSAFALNNEFIYLIINEMDGD